MTFASRTTSAIVEARRVFDGIGGLAFHDPNRRSNSPPRSNDVAMSPGSCALGSGHDSASLTVGKLC
jgi:hypothetical protein